MKSLRFLDRRAGFSLGAVGLLLGMIMPAAFPAFASADNQISSRSITLSSSAAGASSVTQKITFTPVTGDGTSTYYVALVYCNDTPVIGQSCTAPTGFDASGISMGTGSTDATAAVNGTPGTSYAVVSTKLTASTPVTIVLDGFHNPTNATTSSTGFYARIETFAAASDAQTAASTPATTTNVLDDGGVAMSITDAIGISAAVRETMTFCVAGQDIWENCAHTNAPSLILGEGTPKALTTSNVSTGSDYAQISTNAANGAVVYMKNSNSCGGLKRTGASGCDIAPATGGGSDFTAGNALFGVKLGAPFTATTDGSTASTLTSGTLTTNASYAHYNMMTSGTTSDSSGSSLTNDVTGTYGGYLFGTNAAPIAQKNVQMTFGASSSNVTPAGLYTATINLIAVGTY